MAIATYAELKTAIATWSNRSDLTVLIPDFIRLAEGRLNDMLLLKNFESEESLTIAQNDNFVALPSGYISPVAFWLIVDGERVLLQMVLPQQLPYDTESNQPQAWAIDGDNIRFDCPSDDGYSAKFRMLKSSNLSDSNTTNYLLTRRPDIYLAGAMVEVGRYTRNENMIAQWEPKFIQASNELKAVESRNRAVQLRTDIGSGGRSNIFRGD